MTNKTKTCLITSLAGVLLFAAAGIRQASACGAYSPFLMNERAVRRVVGKRLADDHKRDKKAGNFVQRRITEVRFYRGDLDTAVVSVTVTWNFQRFTEKLSLVKLDGRWRLARRWRVPLRRVKSRL